MKDLPGTSDHLVSLSWLLVIFMGTIKDRAGVVRSYHVFPC